MFRCKGEPSTLTVGKPRAIKKRIKKKIKKMRAELKKKNLRVKIFFVKNHAGKDFFYFLTRTVLSTIYTGENILPIDKFVYLVKV
jgi:hypothetical protein